MLVGNRAKIEPDGEPSHAEGDIRSTHPTKASRSAVRARFLDSNEIAALFEAPAPS